MSIKLGDTVKDYITGFTGIAGARTEYLTGCIQFGVIPKTLNKDGKPQVWEWFDESRLMVKKIDSSEAKLGGDGGPQPMPPEVN